MKGKPKDVCVWGEGGGGVQIYPSLAIKYLQ